MDTENWFKNWIIQMKTYSVAPLGMSLVASCALRYSLLETKLNDLNYFTVTHEIWPILSGFWQPDLSKAFWRDDEEAALFLKAIISRY